MVQRLVKASWSCAEKVAQLLAGKAVLLVNTHMYTCERLLGTVACLLSVFYALSMSRLMHFAVVQLPIS